MHAFTYNPCVDSGEPSNLLRGTHWCPLCARHELVFMSELLLTSQKNAKFMVVDGSTGCTCAAAAMLAADSCAGCSDRCTAGCCSELKMGP